MFSMKNKSLEFARILKNDCELLVAGGPLPTTNPELFLDDFDVVVVGEGEQTMLQIAVEVEKKGDLSKIRGIVYKEKDTSQIRSTAAQEEVEDLDSLPFPFRELFDNSAYKNYYSKKYGYTTTAVMTSRGCPFSCDFCSRPIFGNSFRSRTATKVVDEIEEVVALGYDRIWFADDCFTLNRERLLGICNEIIKRGLRIEWECLSRVDTLDAEAIEKMKQAGCIRMFFGIESGNDSILELMNKQITINQVRAALSLCEETGVKAGAFFIVGYPGENDETVLQTVKFASSLPLDYLSFTMPYPIPGTPLYSRLNGKMVSSEWEEPKNIKLVKHKLLFNSKLSEGKLKFAIVKGMIQFYVRKYTGKKGYRLLGVPFESLTNSIYRLL
jgi:anaerobic magnesium-protoporphyrin IX monomethyl ester cyclase